MNALRRILATAALVAAFFSIPASAQKVETDYDQLFCHLLAISHLFVGARPRLRSSFREPYPRGGREHPCPSRKGMATGAGRRRCHADGCRYQDNEPEYTTFYEGLGGGWRWHGWGTGMTTTTVEKIPVGTLVVDIYDCSSRNLIWRGEAQEQLSDKPNKAPKSSIKQWPRCLPNFRRNPCSREIVVEQLWCCWERCQRGCGCFAPGEGLST